MPLTVFRPAGWMLVAALLAGCNAEQPKDYVARVGNEMLTMEEVVATVDTTEHDAGAVRAYVNQWVVSSLLYQEAERRGITGTDELHRRVEHVRRKLAIDALLEDALYAKDSPAVSEDAIVAMYNSGGPIFMLKEDVVNISSALFADRDAANAFRSRILRGGSWDEAVLWAQQDSSIRLQLLQLATRQYFTRANLYPEELWKLARTLGKDQISFVLRTDAGYYVLIVHNSMQQGDMPDIGYVRNEIRDRLLIEQRQRAYEELITSLRAKQQIEVKIPTTDSSTSGAE